MFGRFKTQGPAPGPVSDAPDTLDKKSQDNGDSNNNNNKDTTGKAIITAPTGTGSVDADDDDDDQYPKGLRLALVLSSV